jgi:hypothetical protein
MQDKWDGPDEQGPDADDTESTAGELKPISRLGVVGARASLLLGLGLSIIGVAGTSTIWPTVSRDG